MSKRLVITEKPSVALDIAEALGGCDSHDKDAYYENDEFVITYAVGHLLELNQPETYKKEWKRWSLSQLPMIPEKFLYSTRDSKATKRLQVIKKLAKRKDVSGVINACDAGREGEHIFRTIVSEFKKPLPIERLWLQSLTSQAIQEGFASLRPGEEFDNLASAAACRSEADWLIGMNATRALTIRLRSLRYEGAWSAGRVQTPTLSMMVERELEILAHRPETYWQFEGTFTTEGHTYTGTFMEAGVKSEDKPDRVMEPARRDALIAMLDASQSAIASEKRTTSQDKPPLLFHLTDLQRAANSTMGFTSKRTLASAQRLYEQHKLLSYPRTDSRYLPEDQQAELEQMINTLGYMPAYSAIVKKAQGYGIQNLKRIFNNAKVSDHHAIVPLGIPKAGQLDEDDQRIFDLVVRRYLAAFMPAATWARVSRNTVVQADEELRFHSSGKVLAEPGWQFAMGKDKGHGDPLPELSNQEGTATVVSSYETKEKQTKPRGRLTEAGLLSKMENCGKDVDDEELSEALSERGLGTPATRADTIERLISRGFVIRDGKSLRPTSKAMRLMDLLERVHADSLCSVALTGEMEYRLRQVEAGELDRDNYMETIQENTIELTGVLKDFDYDALYEKEEPLGLTPDSDNPFPVKENLWGYGSLDEEDPNAFFIFKDIRGHVITPQEMTELLASEGHSTGPVTFTKVQGRKTYSYKGNLKLVRLSDEEYEKLSPSKKGRKPSRFKIDVEVLDDDGNPIASGLVPTHAEEEVLQTLVITEDGTEIVETTQRYVDREHVGKSEPPLAVLPKEICERRILPEEAIPYFTEGKTEILHRFRSKKGRNFRAMLIKKKNGRHGFDFPPRERTKSKKTETPKEQEQAS
ncbi:MAG: hypothetical protein EP343_26720 [Deltaproteobacteria bacterium]|nr:MAG: hypothetical protein EP343_26720 [Deltaproteobacteria bacterium]